MEEKKMDILTQLKRTNSTQPPRRIKFIERYLDEDANFQKPGIFRVPVQQVNHVTIQHAQYVIDPEVFEQQVNSLTRYPQLRLANAGSSCFANATCQAVLAISSFRSLLASDYYQRIKSPVAKSLTLIQKSADKGLEAYLQTLPIFSMSPYNQSDATELFYKILDHLHQAECESAGAELKDQTTAVDQLFSFAQQQEIVCERCKGIVTHQFLSRSCFLRVCPTLKKAFKDFLKGVAISGYQCEYCGKDADITKKQQVVQAARVFVIQLQRWNEYGQKVNNNIRIPEFLDLSNGVSHATVDAMAETNGKSGNLAAQVIGSMRTCNQHRTHQLKAVICHSGISVHSGHYVAYVNSGGWQLRDDDMIITCKYDDITFNEAVLLIYEQQTRERAVLTELTPQTQELNQDFGERIPDQPTSYQAAEQCDAQADAPTIEFKKDELLDKKAMYSELLHAKADDMDADIDKARRRKTQKDRDRNRAIREEEIKQRRAEKYQKWVKRQKFGKFGTKLADQRKKGQK